MQKNMDVRLIAFHALTPDHSPGDPFFTQTTAEDLAEADKLYDEWYDKTYSGGDIVRANEAYSAIMGLKRTCEQAAFESGFKTGARLMIEILNGVVKV